MLIRVRRSWKDFVEGKPHKSMSRRDFIKNGLLTGAMSFALPQAMAMALAKNARGSDTLSCPSPTLAPGALAAIYRFGGPTCGSMFLNKTQADFLTAPPSASTAAFHYGINPANLIEGGSNWWLPQKSAFATGLGMNGNPPAGYSVSQWNAILKKTAMTSQIGTFSADDAAGANLGLIGAASPFKGSSIGGDLQIGVNRKLATWAVGAPATSIGVNRPTNPETLAAGYSIHPSVNVTNGFRNASTATAALIQAFTGILYDGTSSPAFSKAACGFQGATVLGDPAFGTNLFDRTKLPSGTLRAENLTDAEQAWLLAYYQSAVGTLGGIFIQQQGQDYHGHEISDIANSDYEAGRMIAMFIAACDLAGKPGAIILTANGQAIATGYSDTENGEPITVTNGTGTAIHVEGPVAKSDSGGTYNAGFILCYNPHGAPTLKACGTKLDPGTGNFKSPVVNRVDVAVASLYLTAFKFLHSLETGYDYDGIATLVQNTLPGQNVPILI